ncbi:MAG: SGNH/GDSL hydrolase family protein [Lachnospiraceae bacterium]|nr:SGNH/GDSL hydrolase family protein [Lachnospiraceae bacterium]
MVYYIQKHKGMIYRGNWSRLKECMKKAREGREITAGFLGGSITQGSLSSSPETCYAYLVYEWWRKRFPKAKIKYVNAGIGGTTSQFGAARVEDHLLKYAPDFVLTEFAVNDENTEFFEETYEGLIRKIYGNVCSPAVLLMCNVRYDDGTNAEQMHGKIAQAYQIPMVSMKAAIWPEVEAGRIQRHDITPDNLHPNDAGHKLVAEVIIDFLEKVFQDMDVEEAGAFGGNGLPAPVTVNAYENSRRYQNFNIEPELNGFGADLTPQKDIRDIFKGGWTASREGDRIRFEIVCTGIAVQYRKSVNKPAPVARAVVDGREDEAVLLDGNFEEDWGDSLHIDTIASHMEKGSHVVEVSIVEAHKEDAVPFYLVSVIGSN